MTLDVFLESDTDFDREEVERALARNGVPADSTVTTADGGEASVTLDDDGSVFVIQSLTPELAQILFDVARTARLAILPADGTPNALIVEDADVPDELERRASRQRRRPSTSRSAGARSCVELVRPDSVSDAVASLGNGAVALGGGTDLVALLRDRIVDADTLVELRNAVPKGIDGTTIGAGTTLGRARGRRGDPRGAARGVPPLGVAAAPRRRDDRRQPPAGDALLVLAPQVPLPPARRRPLPRARGPAPRARDLRERLLRVGAPVRPRCRAARARHDGPHRPARAAARRAVPAADARTTVRRPRSRPTS